MRIIILLLTPLFFLTSCMRSEPTTTLDEDGSHPRWNLTNIGAEQVQKIITANPNIGIIDVRTPAEFAEGHIKGAINVDFNSPDFAEQISKVDNDQPYILYCRSGNRSGKTLPVLKNSAFGSVYHLEKGFNSWKAAGMPVER